MKRLFIYPSIALVLLTGCNHDTKQSHSSKADIKKQEDAVHKLKANDFRAVSYKESVSNSPQKINNQYGSFNYDYVRDHDDEVSMKQYMNKKKIPQKGAFTLAIAANDEDLYVYKNEEMSGSPKKITENTIKEKAAGVYYNRYHHYVTLFKEAKHPSVKGNQYTFNLKDNPALNQLNSGGLTPIVTKSATQGDERLKNIINQHQKFLNEKLEKGYVTFSLKNDYITNIKMYVDFKNYAPNKINYKFYDFNHKEDVTIKGK